jgi:NAD(P)-dependent dehydrogenase (short-subunit alcohol dehydrogenase family)
MPMNSVCPGDLSLPSEVDRLISRVVERYGGFDVLVNTGSRGAFAPVEVMDFESVIFEWHETLAT